MYRVSPGAGDPVAHRMGINQTETNMNENQKAKYDECEREISKRIAEHENYALALSIIEYNPKADGTERVNFDENFSIRGLGAKVKYASGIPHRRVKVKPVTYYGWYDGKQDTRVTCLDITVLPIKTTEDMEKAGVEEPVELVNDMRFAFSIYTGRKDMPTDTRPEEYVKIIREEIVPGIRKRIKGLHGELTMLPKVFGKIIEASNAYEEARRMSEGTDCLKYLVGNMSNVSGLHD